MQKAAPYIDWLIVMMAFLSGLLHPDVAVFYESALVIFLIIIVPLFLLSFLLYRFSEKYGNRIQSDRKKQPPIAGEAFGSARAAFIVSCMAAPVAPLLPSSQAFCTVVFLGYCRVCATKSISALGRVVQLPGETAPTVGAE